MFKPISTKCFIAFLKYKGFELDRIASSHHHYKKAGKITVTVQGNEKQVPGLHLQTNCKSIGCTTDELYAWAEKNC